MHSRSRKINALPNETQQDILKWLPQKSINRAMRVNKAWYNIGKKILYKNVRFYSVSEREKFFEMLSQIANSVPSPTSRTFSSPMQLDPVEAPPEVRIPRRRSKRLNPPSGIAKLIQTLDFGLRPRTIGKNEPPLPCTRPIVEPIVVVRTLQQPKPNEATQSSPMQNSPSERSPLGHNSKRNAVVSRTQNQKSLPTSPTRTERNIANLRVEINHSENSTYGSWSDRFVSPLLPVLAELIPNLLQLNLCGCHIAPNDFRTLMEALKHLTHLDVSYTTLKGDALMAVARFQRHNLIHLNVSGIFKFFRNKPRLLIDISFNCMALETVIALDCPDLYAETFQDIDNASGGRIKFLRDEEDEEMEA